MIFFFSEYMTAAKFEKPSAVQSQCWTAALIGRDVITQAQTGTGKTLSYLLPIIPHILSQKKIVAREGPIALIIVPTRELTLQVQYLVVLF
jgi:superfamily II DNA/RNA helicase